MEYELYLVSHLNQTTLKHLFSEIVSDVVGEQVKVSDDNYDDHCYVSCQYFSMSIETNDIYAIEYLREEYKMNIDTEISIQLIAKTYVEGLEVLFKVFGKLIKKIQGDMVFEENGSRQLFRKEGDVLIVNTNLHPYQKQTMTEVLLGFLDFPYIEMDLSSVE